MQELNRHSEQTHFRPKALLLIAAAIALFLGIQALAATYAAQAAGMVALAHTAAPIAVDDSATINEDDPLIIDVVANDTDADGDILSLDAVGVSADATLTISGTKQIVVDPLPDFNGTIVFNYTVSDGALTDSGTVTVTVLPVNDPPIAVDDVYFSTEDIPLVVGVSDGVLSNDIDPDDVTLFATLQLMPSVGNLQFEFDGSFVYTPTFNYSGTVTFTYTVEDGPATVFIPSEEVVTLIIDEDTDGDTVANFLDFDDDNDGILDSIEGEPTRDTDGDNIPDYLDIDSDNDGLPDMVEAQTTLGFELPINEDANGDGWDSRWDSAEGGTPPPLPNFDASNDNIPDYLDRDSDNDTLPDVYENGISAALTQFDSDGDGLDDAFEGINVFDDNRPNDEIVAPLIDIPDSDNDVTIGGDVDYRDVAVGMLDVDGDNVPNIIDLDDDNDGISDEDELLGFGQPRDDIDRDGIPNFRDLDSDNNGVPDTIENNHPDQDFNGIHDGWLQPNPDQNNNGLLDALEGNPTILVDSDQDLRPDFRDFDNINSGVPDTILFGLPDTNQDGIHDGWLLPNPDSNANGWLDTLEGLTPRPARQNALAQLDDDNDGVHNWNDIDFDQDGIDTVTELNILDQNNDNIHDGWELPNPDANHNGLLDSVEPSLGGTPFAVQNSDSDSQPNFRDIDDDNDGVPTVVEAQLLSNYQAPSQSDSNQNGLDDQFDPAIAGFVSLTEDSDGDLIPNHLDSDSNGNGLPDIFYNGIGIVLSGLDTDGDGLDDAFERNNVASPYVAHDGIKTPLALFLRMFDTTDEASSVYLPILLVP